MATETETMVYAGRARCGCVRAYYVDDPPASPYVAQGVSALIRDGYTVERMTVAHAREALCERVHVAVADCPCRGAAGEEV